MPVPSVTPRVVSGVWDAGRQRVVEGLEEAAKIFKEAAQPSPPIIIINQLPPPASPSPVWHQDPEIPAVVAAVGFLVCILLVGGLLWMRKHRPARWEMVKSWAWRLVRWLALPLSWALERAAGFLRYLHASVETQQAKASSSTGQVSKTVFFI